MTKKQFLESIPEALRTRLYRQFGRDACDVIYDAWFQKRATTFRRNAIFTSPEDLQNLCKTHAITATSVPGIADAYTLVTPDASTFFNTPLVSEGHVYVQSTSSMLPVVALDPKPGDRILDLCAAPGSKTTQIASVVQNNAHIIACDISRVRIYKLEANLKIQGVTCVTSYQQPGESIWQTYPEYFDKTLVDVPCSMEGTIQPGDTRILDEWSPKRAKILGGKQRWLIRSGVSATKPGGTIVYSTCTLSPDENESVVDWILKKEAGHIELIDAGLDPRIPSIPGMQQWNEKLYDPSIHKTCRILPSETYEGFFVAKFRKLESSVASGYLK